MFRPSRTSRTGAALAVTAGLLLTLATPVAAAAAVAPVDACEDPDAVTVVVDSTDLGGGIEVGCADAPETGTEALQAAGFTDTRDDASMICAINGLPDPCPTTFEGSYWSYWTAEPGGEWEMWAEGSDTAQPAPGSVEGWRYHDGSEGPRAVTVDAAAADEAEVAGTAVADTDEGATTWPLVVGGVVVLGAVVGALLLRRRSVSDATGAAAERD